MAFDKATFKTRAGTALLFVAVMGVGLFWSTWSFFILFSAIHFGCWQEYAKLVKKIAPDLEATKAFWWMALALVGWCGLLYFSNGMLQVGFFSLQEGGFWCGLLLLIALPLLLWLQKGSAIQAGGYGLLGLLYISLPLALLIDLRTHWADELSPLNFTLPLLLIFTIWVNDTMAYIVGSFIGKTPLSKISPKKTWEGTVGGALLAVGVMAAAAYFSGRLPVVHAAVIAFLAAAAGTVGDLAESKLKRLAGVKDSGTIMPGHGGFLDRFDSVLFAVVVVWAYTMIVW